MCNATLTFKIDCGVAKINFSFSFYIYQKVFGGLKYQYHNERVYNYSRAIIEHNIKTTRNGNKWEQKKSKIQKEEFQLL